MLIFINNTQLCVYKYKHYVHAHIVIHISIKVNIIHIFHMNIRLLITFLHRRFVHIHTFFHRKIMCCCRLATCLYDIRQTSYERRLHHGYVATPVPIWATFYICSRQDMPVVDLSRHACPEPCYAAAIIYRHILLGENGDAVICTRAHEKNPARFFSRQAIICTVYCWEKYKKL